MKIEKKFVFFIDKRKIYLLKWLRIKKSGGWLF